MVETGQDAEILDRKNPREDGYHTLNSSKRHQIARRQLQTLLRNFKVNNCLNPNLLSSRLIDKLADGWKDLIFTPTEAPVYGGQSMFISCGGNSSPLQKDELYYLLFKGSNLRHITATKFVNPFTLQAVIPDHDVAETTELLVICIKNGETITQSKCNFTYTLDMTVLLAQSLAMNCTNSTALKQIEIMYTSVFVVTAEEHRGLDQRLLSAFKQQQLPDSWSLVTEDGTFNLLHLCAKYNLLKLAEFLFSKQGAVEATLVKDENGQNPIDIAEVNQNVALLELFSRTPTQGNEREEEKTENQKPIIKRHKLGTTTITSTISNGQRTVEQDVKLLEDLHNLALESKKNAALKQNKQQEGTYSHPLAHSLQKLREINLEIQRLRNLTQAEDFQAEDTPETRLRSLSCPDTFDDNNKDASCLRKYSASLDSFDEEKVDMTEQDEEDNELITSDVEGADADQESDGEDEDENDEADAKENGTNGNGEKGFEDDFQVNAEAAKIEGEGLTYEQETEGNKDADLVDGEKKGQVTDTQQNVEVAPVDSVTAMSDSLECEPFEMEATEIGVVGNNSVKNDEANDSGVGGTLDESTQECNENIETLKGVVSAVRDGKGEDGIAEEERGRDGAQEESPEIENIVEKEAGIDAQKCNDIETGDEGEAKGEVDSMEKIGEDVMDGKEAVGRKVTIDSKEAVDGKEAGDVVDTPGEIKTNEEKFAREAERSQVTEDVISPIETCQDEDFHQQEFMRSASNVSSESRMLTAVTEETEEELLELDRKGDTDHHAQKSHSLEELKELRMREERMHHSAEQMYMPREVVTLRKGILKKDRPLSDNYENIKMIARENQLNRLGKQSDSDDSSSGLDKRKSKSLDMLLVDEENRKSPSLTSSQLSLSDVQGSADSLQSIERLERGAMPLYRTKSAGSASLGNRSSVSDHRSSMSDICLLVRDDFEEPIPMIKKKRTRFSFKRKSKSTTSLDKKGVTPSEEDRRKTIMGGISTEVYAARRSEEFEKSQRRNGTDSQRYSNRDSGIDSICELRLDDIMITTSGNYKEGLYSRSISEMGHTLLPPRGTDRNRSSSEVSGERDTEDELDIDTDEGTSSEIAERVRKSSIAQEEKKKEKKFGLLRSKPKKDKKSSKDKEKEAAEKALKKSHKEGKSFLGKKPSFRQGPKSAMSSNLTDSKMFARASSLGKPGGLASMENVRGSGRGTKQSPVGNRRTVHEVDGIADFEYQNTTINSALSSSRTSLDSLSLEEVADAPYQVDDLSQYDSDLDLKNDPETWSDLVEKKVQRKLHAKDIKRQDVIYELIFTESNYVRTLKIVSRIYAVGLKRELGMDPQMIEDLFPRLDDLLEINGTLCKEMKQRQQESNNNVIEEIGDILINQFSDSRGERMKEVYGYFCSRHLQAVALYKELMKTDKKFALFVRKCMLNERVRRLSIPECITLATQRLTKYPLLFEAILKATKESKSDYQNLKESLVKVKEVLMAVDDYVREYEKEQQLQEIKRKFDSKGEVQFKNGKTFKNSKLFTKRSVLLHDGTLTWKEKSKSVEVRAVLLADKIVFLHEKDQRYTLCSLDNKSPVIYLKSLLAREVATDMRALYLVNNEGPEMYELVCSSTKIKNQWMQMIKGAIENRPDEEEENQSDLEEEMRKEEESRITRLKDIMEGLQVADYQFVNLIADKNKLVVEMRELIEKMASSSKDSTSNLELTATDVLEGRETLEKAISEASSLTTLLYDSDLLSQHSPLHQVGAQGAATAPKRAETFGGFDTKPKTLAPPIHVSRASSLKQDNRLSVVGKPLGTMETDHGGKDPKDRVRKTSQGLMSVIVRNSKPAGSNEDLSSASSSNSSLAQVPNTTAQKILAVTQLKDYLTSLMDITNKQDIELASIRVELHTSRSEINKLRSERQMIEERLNQQQKEHERQMNRQKESYAKLEREFKRTVDKFNKQINEYKYQQQIMMEKYTELQKFMQSSQAVSKGKSNSLSALRNRHHTMQPHEVPSHSHTDSKRGSGNQEEFDDREVIFF